MKSPDHTLNFRLFAGFSTSVVILFLILLFFCSNTLFAKPVDVKDAQKAVKGWIKLDSSPLGVNFCEQVLKTDVFADAQGEPIYYVVYLESGGFVIVSADDLIEPIVGFVASGTFDPSQDNPLGALVSRDMPNRIAAVRAVQPAKGGKVIMRDMAEQEAFEKAKVTAQGKWSKLHVLADSVKAKGLSAEDEILGAPPEPNLSNIRVSPLLQSKWDQAKVCGDYCYNYYTPNHYVCGCVATAMAQLMRFHQYPTAGIGHNAFTIYINGSSQTAYTRGGNGIGGPYNWSQMTPDPNADCNNFTGVQREAIGSLCYDAGVAVNMQYASDGSGAYMWDAQSALLDTFLYGNAIFGYNSYNNIGPGLNGMMNPNLDAGYPVLLGIHNSGGGSGHAIVADGYGYNSSTLYHHLNMGWTGQDDAWYNLPNIGTFYGFNIIDSCIYNIFKTGTGEIISGRVTDQAGNPVSTVTVTAQGPGGPYSTETGSSGIYALRVMSGSTYTVGVTDANHYFPNRNVTTGTSTSYSMLSGNRWQVDFVGTLLTVPTAFGSDVEALPAEANVIELHASDDGFPNPPGKLAYTILSLPSHGILNDPCAGVISSVPYTLVNDGNTVIYTPDANAGTYSFYFRVNDGGTPPCGGSSNIAGVTIDVCPAAVSVYETEFTGGLPEGWTIVNGGTSGNTWRSDNPYGRTNENWNGTFMIVDSDYAGTVDMDEQLITPNINFTNRRKITLSFTHAFVNYSGNEFADVDVCINGGSWINVSRYHGANASGLVVLDISSIADGHGDVRIRWHYYNANWDYYWGIDNVRVTAVSGYTPIAGDFDINRNIDFHDFAIFGSAWLSSFGQGNWNSACDIARPKDGIINETDLAVLAEKWLNIY